ncbi:DUF4126 domain-containing protein [Tenacibaculum mesophilum]|uniref:DUF4126 domain-containing protein n=1 Tax=Tenacibaculum mesophilum TaxID=104268 RepID=UPI00064B143B|nr:DUF4126 domain-containing protein [Tenacibaculum mesophilum]GFD72584.1 hypothetical protein KUL113_20040 [Tenacibaculum sp. KUL113]GFD83802.1 hypothetical protein KUL118_66640 [Tenacibaculum sp. KUL118]|eukprot:TRINITY_DN3346_c0_g2_i3.p1 TRINITY_DN3346_c0_g2~~TRINITY_DN3346_c0_g2_i3.p1  ORF type:complete len:208 (-),score=23.39 TRINITY_DN3346_c0_g2_i3:86-658(-)
MTPETIISIFLGIGLAASVGFRVFLPLFTLSLAGYYNVIPLNENWLWVASTPAIIALGVATILEIFAYYIPWFDNLLDTIAVPLAAVAGTAVMVSTVADLSPVITWALAIIAGGGTASAIKGTAASTRLTSTATTGGVANPIISTVETGTSLVMSAFSIFFPILAIILVILIFISIRKMFKYIFSKSKKV